MRSLLATPLLAGLLSACAAAPPAAVTRLTMDQPRSTSTAVDPLAGFDAYARAALAAWGAPGMAVAVVRGDGPPVVRGYGARALGGAPVGPDTIFPIASLTKTFTAAAAGVLVHEGKMRWDDAAVRHLPTFALSDARASHELTLRDLAAHRSGLGEAADLLWFGTGFDRAEVLARLRRVEIMTPIRHTFSYSNVLYLALGEAAAHAAGTSWESLVKTRLLDPAGLSRTRFGVRGITGEGDLARPHAPREGALRALDPRDAANIAPAADLHSSAADLARWLRVFLDRGQIEGRRVLPEPLVDEMLTPQMLVNLSARAKALYPQSHFLAYGLGWMLQDYRGRLVAWNTGGLDGASCSVAVLPEEKIALAVLTNVPWTGLPEAMIFRLIDAHLGAPEKDWSALRLSMSLENRAKEAQRRRALEGDKRDTHPPLPLERYLGAYTSDLMGPALIEVSGARRGEAEPVSGAGLSLRLSASLRGALEPWRGPVFRVHFDDPGLGVALCTFTVSAEGKVTGFELEDHGKFARAPGAGR